MTRKQKQRVYAIYKGDKFIDVGTKREIADQLGITPNSVTFLASPSHKKRSPNDRFAIFIGYEEDLEE
ncbi:hypothetical protein [Streptococcus phocae]|uniref:Uncharacterized protein n=1 Tax=Streptococcus phocae TaxID=119224 RepID=A0A0P6SCS5_9STRE|nr:hypothetical protein [Streptococcus phocae]KPJ21806.1 hypothetical protein AKK44_07960 [Streptococcus phocae]